MSGRDTRRVRALVARYLDPRRSWRAAHEAEARALRRQPDGHRVWVRAIALHRALVGAPEGLPSGVERQRQLATLLAGAGIEPARPARPWWHLAGPLTGVAAAVLVAVFWNTATPNDEWIRARGLSGDIHRHATVGVGVGGVTDDGREYEPISSKSVRIEDWLRFSYTNESRQLGWLYLVGLQEHDDRLAIRPIAPLPDEEQSLEITRGRFRQLPFETRLASRHEPGPLRLLALFTARPLSVSEVDRALAALDSGAHTALPSELEAELRTRLTLSPNDVVQVLDTRIVAGSEAPLPPPRAPADAPPQETP